MTRKLAWIGGAILLLSTGRALAQAPEDSKARLLRILPNDASRQVIQTLEEAERHGLPVAILQRRILELSAKGVAADRIVEAIAKYSDRFKLALTVLKTGRSAEPTGEEIDAGATALRSGMDSATLADFARSAPSDRSIALPLLMVASLADRNVALEAAMDEILTGLRLGKSDEQLATLASAENSGGDQPVSFAQRPVPGQRVPRINANQGRPHPCCVILR